ncbi:MAG: thioredoxin family protein [Candidatus Brocadiia bacterium]
MKRVQVLGAGCPRCRKLAENAQAAVAALGAEYRVEKVTDIAEILKFGVMMTPALAVDGEVKVVGRVPDVEEIRKLLA